MSFTPIKDPLIDSTELDANTTKLAGIETSADVTDAANVGAVLVAGEGVDISGVTISGEDASSTNKGIASFNADDFALTAGVVRKSHITVRARANATLTVATATTTAVPFAAEDFDTDGMHDVSTNNTRLTINTPGVYVLAGTCYWAALISGKKLVVGIRLNGTTLIGGWNELDTNVNDAHFITVACIWDAAVDDYFELVVWQSSGGNHDLTNSGSNQLAAVRVSDS